MNEGVTRVGLSTFDWFATCCSRQFVVGEGSLIGLCVCEVVRL